jgi:hypothetical protein
MIEEAQRKVQEAEEARQQAEIGLRLTTIRAPILESAGPTASQPNRRGTGVVVEERSSSQSKRSFVVLEHKVTVNQEIGSSNQGHLFTLASDLRRVRVTAEVGEGEIDRVRRGMAVRFSVGNAGDNVPKSPGAVEDFHLMPSNEHGAVYHKVEIDAHSERDKDTGDWKLGPGLTASLNIVRRLHHDTWKVPSATLHFEPYAKQQSNAAREKKAQRDSLPHPEQWETVWTVGEKGRPWPIFVRTGGKDKYGDEITDLARTVTTVLQLLVAIVAGISLVVGGIGVMNIVLVSVTERTREISIRMAVGATPANALAQFPIESLVISVARGIIGLTLGLALAFVLAGLIGWPLVNSPTAILVGCSVSAAVGMFFGYYPAWKASRLEPIEALRHE